MYTNKKTARIAGLLYLVVVVTGMFSLAYVPSKLIVWNDAAQTVSNITGNELLFRLGIVSSLVCYTFFLFLPIVLYQLLKSVNKTHAKVMVILAIVSVPISFVNMINKFAVLSLISGSSALKGIAIDQMHTQVMFYLDLYNSGILIVQIFWGLWLFPLGYLIFRSGFLPKFLGVLLMAGCFGYLLNFLGNSLWTGYSELSISSYVRLPASLGEIGTCLWLLLMGAKEKKTSI